MKKLLSLLAATGLIATTSATVVACGEEPKDNQKVSLDTVITVKELGEINNTNQETILAAVKSKNDKLDISQVEASDITNSKAKIKVKADSTSYIGEEIVEVTYSVKSTEKVALDTIITNKDLGEIKIAENSTTPTVDQILKAAKEKNSSLDTSQVEITDSPTDSKAIIKVKTDSTSYIENGSVEVTYSVKITTEKVALDTIITNKALGEIKIAENSTTPTVDQILNAAKEKNSSLDTSQVEVSDITDSNAKIKVKADSTSYIENGSVEVTYSVKITTEKVAIDTIITNKDLGEIKLAENSTTPTVDQILNAAKEKNSSLDTSQVEVSDITDSNAKIKVKADSTSYIENGSVEVTYSVKILDERVDLSTINVNKFKTLFIGMSKDDVNKPIENFITSTINGISTNDYTINFSGETNILEENEIVKIVANPESKLVKGELTFNLSKPIQIDFSGEQAISIFENIVVEIDKSNKNDENVNAILTNIAEQFAKKLKASDFAWELVWNIELLNQSFNINYYSDQEGTIIANDNEKIKLIKLEFKSEMSLYFIKFGMAFSNTLSLQISEQ